VVKLRRKRNGLYITPWSLVLHGEPVVAQPLVIFPPFYGT
jgi:hypothetical protein